MSDAYAPIKKKCTYWREHRSDDDRFDSRIKAADKRVECSCVVEGKAWQVTASTIPSDCPDRLHCR
ncbi:MAG: hypothetical protein Q7W16_08190, partial [Coriobacteriia bacterium]|nr:hypothetical protein [Coriobacteriia bacterium]